MTDALELARLRRENAELRAKLDRQLELRWHEGEKWRKGLRVINAARAVLRDDDLAFLVRCLNPNIGTLEQAVREFDAMKTPTRKGAR